MTNTHEGIRDLASLGLPDPSTLDKRQLQTAFGELVKWTEALGCDTHELDLSKTEFEIFSKLLRFSAYVGICHLLSNQSDYSKENKATM